MEKEIINILTGIGSTLNHINDRLHMIDGRLGSIEGRLDGIDVRLDGIDVRLDGIDVRLDGIDGRLDGIDRRLDVHDQMHQAHQKEFGKLYGFLGREFNHTHGRLERLENEVKDIMPGVLVLLENERSHFRAFNEGLAECRNRLDKLEQSA